MKIVLVMACLIGQVYLEEGKVEQKSAKQILGPGPGLMPAIPGAGSSVGVSSAFGAQAFGAQPFGAQPIGAQPFGAQGFRQSGQRQIGG